MTDYSDLVQRLRGKKLNCICVAKSASECCCNTDWPESSCNEAAEAIEILERDIVLVMDAMVALTDRVHELKAALKPFADASDVHLGSDDMSIAFRIIIGNLRQARKVLGEK